MRRDVRGMKPIQMPCILSRVGTKADGSLSLNFSTSELNAQETTVLIMLCRINLTMLLTPLAEELEAPQEVKAEMESKSPSQRLRNVLFAVFAHEKQIGKVGKDDIYDVWYPKQMEKLIEFCKKRLPEQQ